MQCSVVVVVVVSHEPVAEHVVVVVSHESVVGRVVVVSSHQSVEYVDDLVVDSSAPVY